MKPFKQLKNQTNTKAYLTIQFGNRKITTEVTVLGEKNNKAIVTSDFKRTALVDKFLLTQKENNHQRGKSI